MIRVLIHSGEIQDDKGLPEQTLNFQVNTDLFKLHCYPPLSFLLHHVHVLPPALSHVKQENFKKADSGIWVPVG
jgi:hypothetical protein